MNGTDLIDNLRDVLAKDLHASVTREGTSLGLGFRSTTGREIPLVITACVQPCTVRISDGGETWWELVKEGYAAPQPSTPDRDRLVRVCDLYEVHWERRDCEVFGIATTDKAPDLVRRIVAASLAIDAWRAWYPPKDAPSEAVQAIVQELQDAAPHRGWVPEVAPTIRGRTGHIWRPHARLKRDQKGAVVTIFSVDSADQIAQSLIGWMSDVPEPMVAVVPERLAEQLTADVAFQEGLAFVPREQAHTAERILKSADDIAA